LSGRKKQDVCAIVVAGGSGQRMGSELPKQFIEVLGRPVLAYTLHALSGCEEIDRIIVVAPRDYLVYCKDIADAFSLTKVSSIIAGGATRQESVARGLEEAGEETGLVLIHDAVRPMIDAKTIQNCIDMARTCGAAAAGVRAKDTIKRTDSNNRIIETVDRESLWFIQTPQVFWYDLISRAHERAKEEGFNATDDCMLAEWCGHTVQVVEGKYENIKITTPQDIYIMEGLLNAE